MSRMKSDGAGAAGFGSDFDFSTFIKICGSVTKDFAIVQRPGETMRKKDKTSSGGKKMPMPSVILTNRHIVLTSGN